MVDIAEVNEHYKESGYLLIDVRSPDAIKNAAPVGALAVSEEQLIQQAGELSQQYKIIYIICHKGITSQRLCLQLEKSHGNKFQSVQGGFEAWVHQGFAVDGCSHEVDVSRYERQIKLAEFGQGGQDKLKESHILVVGAGGLGSPALMYLTGCGIGTITVIDDDLVALHNLHRQVLYT